MLFAACLAGGCASSPAMHYYILSEVPADARLTAAPDVAPVRLDRVTVPNELDRSELVRRIDATRVQIVEGDRWAAPLDDMIRRVLSGDLATRLPQGMVVDPNEPAIGERRQSLSVDIQEFYGDAACAVTLRAAWVLKQPDTPSLHGNEEARIASSGNCGGNSSLPAAMSQALGQLSDRIAGAIASSTAAPAQQPVNH